MFALELEKNVCYERKRFMEKADNEMYALVDEEFLAKFSNQHLNYMKKLYYSFYTGYCERIKRKPLTSEDFFMNMHLRRFQLYQLCCPYCGTVSLCIHDKKESKTAGYNSFLEKPRERVLHQASVCSLVSKALLLWEESRLSKPG